MIHRRERYSLAKHNTFRMNVSCACFVEYDSPADLAELDFGQLPQPVIHIGAGSNLLFTGDFPGTVLHSSIKYYKTYPSSGDEVLVEVGAGVVFDDFCAWACNNVLWGAENLSGIPGEVGAAAVQNIGAYGAEVKDIVAQVKCFDLQSRRLETIPVSDCAYAYRDSAFKHAPAKGRFVVVGVLFRLSRSAGPNLSYKGLAEAFPDREPSRPGEVRRKVLEIRAGKLPDPAETGSAGSFFKNPVVSPAVFAHVQAVAAAAGAGAGESLREQRVLPLAGNAPFGSAPDSTQVTKPASAQVPHYELPDGSVKIPAAWLIEQCGLKGAELGEAAVYHKQPLVIINKTGNAKPQDIIALEHKIIDSVKAKFGIGLSPEVEHI